MKTISKVRALLLISSITLLPGCSTIINWGKKNLYQGIDFSQNYELPRSFIRSVKAYDEFSTFAHFDVLWLTEEVRNAYVEAFADATGKQAEQKNQLLKTQRDELKHFISFYVVTPQGTMLNTDQSPWHIFLAIDKLTFDPIEIKAIELNSIYKSFFGKRYNRFKTVYLVKFESSDLYDNPLITSTTQSVELHFKKLNKEILLQWDLYKTSSEYSKPTIEESTPITSSNEQARLRKKHKKAS